MTDTHGAPRSEVPGDDSSTAKEFRELVARLSDGELPIEAGARLNALLKDDPIAQELYLDQMLIDGLLELEFGLTVSELSPSVVTGDGGAGGSTGEDAQTVRRRWKPLVTQLWAPLVLSLLAGMATSWLLWGNVVTSSSGDFQHEPIPLANPGFESGTPFPEAAPRGGLWYGDVVEIVGLNSGITPLEGKRMLRFVRSKFEPDDACELYQLVDLRPLSNTIAGGQAFVEATASFNANPHEAWGDGYSFGVTLFAYAEDPQEDPQVWPLRGKQPLSFSGQQEPADTDVETWQPVKARLALPANTTHLLVQVSTVRRKPAPGGIKAEFTNHFVDRVDLALVTQQEQPRWIQALWRPRNSTSNQ